MTTSRPAHVTIELSLHGPSIEGVLRDAHGEPHAFSGLLGLYAAVEAARASADHRPGHPPAASDPV